MSGPIRPNEITREFPAEVYDAFNALITKGFINGSARVDQDEVRNLIVEKLNTTTDRVYAEGWLNVEDAYTAAGWIVVYDKPGHNESYRPFFTFTRPK